MLLDDRQLLNKLDDWDGGGRVLFLQVIQEAGTGLDMFINLAQRMDRDLMLIVQGQTQDLSHVSVKIQYSHLIQQLPPNTSESWQEAGWSKFICRLNNSN